MPITFYYSH